MMEIEGLLAENEELRKALKQSKASHKRIKAECRYVDYQKLQRRFFNKCNELDQLRKLVEEVNDGNRTSARNY